MCYAILCSLFTVSFIVKKTKNYLELLFKDDVDVKIQIIHVYLIWYLDVYMKHLSEQKFGKVYVEFSFQKYTNK